MTTERLEEIKKKFDSDTEMLSLIDMAELIAFAEHALPLMLPTNVFAAGGDGGSCQVTELKDAIPSRGVVAMHLMAALVTRGVETSPGKNYQQMSIEAADALIKELERK